MTEVLTPVDSAQVVSGNSDLVTVQQEEIKKLAEKMTEVLSPVDSAKVITEKSEHVIQPDEMEKSAEKMNEVFSPVDSAKFIAEKSELVTIQQEEVKKLAEKILTCLKENPYNVEIWRKHKLHPKKADEAAIEWIFVADSLNFSFWTEASEKYQVNYQDEDHTGYWSICAIINRALDSDIPLTSAQYMSDLDLNTMEDLCRSSNNTSMPLLEERVKILNENGKILMEKFDGSFVNCVKQAEGSAVKLLRLIVDNFPAFRDEATYKGQRVSFYKRAQILVADIWACCQGEGLGAFSDIEEITTFADYRVPQSLLYFNVLHYTDQLLDKLKKGEMLENGSEEEVEIRGNTIWAVKLLVDELKRHPDCSGETMNSILMDFYLWDYRRDHASDMDHVPFHKTRCIYY